MVDKGQLEAEELLAKLVANSSNEELIVGCIPMNLNTTEGNALEYHAEYTPNISGPIRDGVRVIPIYPGLANKYKTRLIRWS